MRRVVAEMREDRNAQLFAVKMGAEVVCLIRRGMAERQRRVAAILSLFGVSLGFVITRPLFVFKVVTYKHNKNKTTTFFGFANFCALLHREKNKILFRSETITAGILFGKNSIHY